MGQSLEPKCSLILFKVTKETKSQNLLVGTFLLCIKAISGTSVEMPTQQFQVTQQ